MPSERWKGQVVRRYCVARVVDSCARSSRQPNPPRRDRGRQLGHRQSHLLTLDSLDFLAWLISLTSAFFEETRRRGLIQGRATKETPTDLSDHHHRFSMRTNSFRCSVVTYL